MEKSLRLVNSSIATVPYAMFLCLWLLAVISNFLILVLRSSAFAADGNLDTTFGLGGKVTTAIGNSSDFGYFVAIQSDGKIVVAGTSYDGKYNFTVVRYQSQGNLDPSFGTEGKVTTTIGNHSSFAHSVAIQSDGKIVVAGFSHNGKNSDFAVVRYQRDGHLDPSFNAEGKVTTDIGGDDDIAYSVAIQSDGKIIVAGNSYTHNGTSSRFAVVRYQNNGHLDLSFDTDGKVTTTLGKGYNDGRSVAIQSDGKIVVAGSSEDRNNSISSNPNFAVVRYQRNGHLDPSFGTKGKVTTSIGHDHGYSVAIQPDGKIVVAGFSDIDNSINSDFAVVRYQRNGRLDSSFNTNGKVTTDIGNTSDYGRSVAIQSDGKIIVAGSSSDGLPNSDFAVVCYQNNGHLEPLFNTNGKVTTKLSKIASYGHHAHSVAIQSDGKIVVAGFSHNGKNFDFAVVRYESCLGATVDNANYPK